STSEDQTVGIPNAEELRDSRARLVVAFSRSHRERVRAAMRVGVCGLVKVSQRIKDHLRLLRCSGRVEVVKTRVIGEEWKIGAEISSLCLTRQIASPLARTRCSTVPSLNSATEATGSNSGLPAGTSKTGRETPITPVL